MVMCNLVLSALVLFSNVISFSVRDAKTGKPVPYVQVVCVLHGEGGVADEEGKVELRLNQGVHKLKIMHIGYKTRFVEINVPQKKPLGIIYLHPRVLIGHEVEIVDTYLLKSYNARVLDTKIIQRNLSFGEPDALRALQQLPGFVAASDYASAPAIRGMSADYTHFYISDAPVLNPYHVGGLFSAFDAGMIGRIEVYPGIAPARYGDYGGGIVRLMPRFTGNKETKVELGLLSTKFRTLRSPTKNWQTSLCLRYFTIEFLWLIMSGERADYNFCDAQWANRWYLFNGLKLETNFYFSRENLPNATVDRGMETERVQVRPAWMNFVYDITAKWSNFRLSLYHSNAPLDMKTNRNWVHNKMLIYGLRFLHFSVFQSGFFEIGFTIEKHRFNYEWHFYRSALEDIIGTPQYVFFDDAPPLYNENFYYKTTAAFAECTRNFWDQNELVTGIRMERFDGKIYPEPRINFQWKINKWKLGLGYGLVYQFSYTLHEKENKQIFAPFTIRFPAFDHPIDIHTFLMNLQPPLNDSFIIKLYFRRFHHTPVYDWRNLGYTRSHGFTVGFEVSYGHHLPKGDWELNYTLATSRVAWRNHWLPTAQDRRHQLKINVNFPKGKSWRMGWQFQLATGFPYSKVTHWLPDYSESFFFRGAPSGYIPRWNSPNNARYPVYHRLDAMVEKDWHLWGGVLTGRLTILNIYNHKNPYYYEVSYENYHPKVEEIPNFPFLPSFHFIFKF